MKKQKVSGFTTFTILSFAFVWTFEGSTMAPAVGVIAKAFPNASDLQLQNIIVIPFLSAFIFSIIAGKLAKFVDKKTIAIVGLFIYGAMGVLPVFATNINQILLLRLLIGVGAGLILPLASAYISELYSQDSRARLLGLASSVSQFSNFLMSLLVGAILFLGWRAPFYTYFLLFGILICTIISIPRTRHAASDPAASKPGTVAGNLKLTFRHYWYALMMSLIWIFGTFVTLNMALWTSHENLCEPWMLGVIIACCAAGATLGGVIWTYVQKAVKGHLAPISLFLNALGFFLYSLTDSPVVIVAATFVIGLGQGMLTPYVLDLTAKHSTNVVQKDMAFGLVTSSITFGPLVSPLFQEFLLLFNPGVASTYRYKFLCAAVFLFVGCIISLFNQEKDTASPINVSAVR